MHSTVSAAATAKPTFGRWLLKQMKREDAIGALSKCAHQDPGFPIDGDVAAVSKRLNVLSADPDMHIALEDAELDYRCI